jgi:hypothetical protein
METIHQNFSKTAGDTTMYHPIKETNITQRGRIVDIMRRAILFHEDSIHDSGTLNPKEVNHWIKDFKGISSLLLLFFAYNTF